MSNISINQEGLAGLIENYLYRIFIIEGRETSFDEIVEIFNNENIYVPNEILKDSYDFVCDLYDENEKSGWNNAEKEVNKITELEEYETHYFVVNNPSGHKRYIRATALPKEEYEEGNN